MKETIPYNCVKCNRKLYRDGVARNYVYVKGDYYCTGCFMGKRERLKK